MRAGDVAFSAGAYPAGWLIRTWDHSRYNHVRLVLDEAGNVMQATGGGFVRGQVEPGDVIASPPLSVGQRGVIPAIAENLRGTPYGYADVLALGLAQIGIVLPTFRDQFRNLPIDGRTPETFIARPDQLFCSQAVDLAWNLAGYHAFTDGRPPGDVTPGDIFDLAARSNWEFEVV